MTSRFLAQTTNKGLGTYVTRRTVGEQVGGGRRGLLFGKGGSGCLSENQQRAQWAVQGWAWGLRQTSQNCQMISAQTTKGVRPTN